VLFNHGSTCDITARVQGGLSSCNLLVRSVRPLQSTLGRLHEGYGDTVLYLFSCRNSSCMLHHTIRAVWWVEEACKGRKEQTTQRRRQWHQCSLQSARRGEPRFQPRQEVSPRLTKSFQARWQVCQDLLWFQRRLINCIRRGNHPRQSHRLERGFPQRNKPADSLYRGYPLAGGRDVEQHQAMAE
jgi:hypothetical protein